MFVMLLLTTIEFIQALLLEFPLSSTHRTASRLLAEMIKHHKIFQSGLDYTPTFSLGSHKTIISHNQQEVG